MFQKAMKFFKYLTLGFISVIASLIGMSFMVLICFFCFFTFIFPITQMIICEQLSLNSGWEPVAIILGPMVLFWSIIAAINIADQE